MPTASSLDYHPNQLDSVDTLEAREARALAVLADSMTGAAPSLTVTPSVAVHTVSGSVASGCRALTFVAGSTFSGTILTNFPLAAGAGLTIPVPANSVLGAVAYTVSAGSLYSVQVR